MDSSNDTEEVLVACTWPFGSEVVCGTGSCADCIWYANPVSDWETINGND